MPAGDFVAEAPLTPEAKVLKKKGRVIRKMKEVLATANSLCLSTNAAPFSN